MKTLLLLVVSTTLPAYGQYFLLPTANTGLFENGGEERYFVGTVGKSWTSGTFGCVRSDGWQMHEGLDIRCLTRNNNGEPTDTVLATADGTVAYINSKPSLSNYGNYLVVKHQLEGFELYSLYAHLQSVPKELKSGSKVKAGQTIGTMGRTTNTRQGISKERAHVHFEINLMLNDRFSGWFRRNFPGQRDDHGNWNGRNFVGVDAKQLFLLQRECGAAFNLKDFVCRQNELCRIQVRVGTFDWLKRYPEVIKFNPIAKKQGVSGYEVALNYVGVPFEVIPRAESELKSKSRVFLLSVNAEEHRLRPCRKLVSNRSGKWFLTSNGAQLMDLLIY